MRILGISGSLREGSYNRRLLAAAGAELPGGATFELFEGLAGIPPYSEDSEDSENGADGATPATVQLLRKTIAAADGLLIATPEYNASLPGQLKNALDWASRPFPDNVLRNRPVAVLGASTGMFGAVWAQGELRKVLKTIGAQVIDSELPVMQAHVAFTESDRLADRGLQGTLAGIVEQLCAASCELASCA